MTSSEMRHFIWLVDWEMNTKNDSEEHRVDGIKYHTEEIIQNDSKQKEERIV